MVDNQFHNSNKKIAQNTLFLYIRQLFTMIVSLFTVRVILNSLGTDDYGLSNVVIGIVTTASLFVNCLSSATQRYFSIDLGVNDKVKIL